MMDDIEVWNIVALCFNACQVVFVFGAGRCILKSRQVHKHTLAAWNNSCCNGSIPIRSQCEAMSSGSRGPLNKCALIEPDVFKTLRCFLSLSVRAHTHSYISTNRSAHTAPSSVRLPD